VIGIQTTDVRRKITLRSASIDVEVQQRVRGAITTRHFGWTLRCMSSEGFEACGWDEDTRSPLPWTHPQESLAFDHVVLGQTGYLTYPEAAKPPERAWLAPGAARDLGKVQAPVAPQCVLRADHASARASGIHR
jgi:hypothetical protein